MESYCSVSNVNNICDTHIDTNCITQPYLIKAIGKDGHEYMGFYYGYVSSLGLFNQQERKDYILVINEATLHSEATVSRVEIDVDTIRQSTGITDVDYNLLFVGDKVQFINTDRYTFVIVKYYNRFVYVDVNDVNQAKMPLMDNRYKCGHNTDIRLVKGE